MSKNLIAKFCRLDVATVYFIIQLQAL